jgi:hypothetical protein
MSEKASLSCRFSFTPLGPGTGSSAAFLPHIAILAVPVQKQIFVFFSKKIL